MIFIKKEFLKENDENQTKQFKGKLSVLSRKNSSKFKLSRSKKHDDKTVNYFSGKTTVCFLLGCYIIIESVPLWVNYLTMKNKEQYAYQISEHDKEINYYAESINDLNLNDIQVIMKVIDDTWNSIDGYGKAEDVPIGYARLAFKEERKGICSSFADDLTLIVDPTNPSIGVFRNGKIYMLNSNSENLIVYKPIGMLFLSGKHTGPITMEYLSSFKYSDQSVEDLQQEYGLEAQNNALIYVRSIKN